jgi:hypothetical protein
LSGATGRGDGVCLEVARFESGFGKIACSRRWRRLLGHEPPTVDCAE